MKMICSFKCFFKDKLHTPGDVVDMTAEEMKLDIVKSSFRAPAGEDAPKEEKPADKSELSRDDMMKRLDDWGVAYKGNISNNALKKIYDEQVELQTSLED